MLKFAAEFSPDLIIQLTTAVQSFVIVSFLLFMAHRLSSMTKMTLDKLELSLCTERIDQNMFCISESLPIDLRHSSLC